MPDMPGRHGLLTALQRKLTGHCIAGPADIDSILILLIAGSSATGIVTGGSHVLDVWAGAGLIARSLLALLAGFLVAGLAVVADGMRRQRLLAKHARTVATAFWVAPNLYEALNRLEPDSAYREITQTALEAATHLDGRLTDQILASEWISLSLDRAVREVSESLHGLAGALALIAPVGVATGLAGMIWILAGTFVGLAAPELPTVLPARAIEALWIGMLGLVVAGTAAVGYGWLIQQNARATGRVREFAATVRAVLLNADRATFNDGGERPAASPPRDRMHAAVAGS